ncbi:GCN5-related N-acetyltransferase [mine drainage metagenome]|uniref:GCN5-related N-acetyltransferase n=1 Tax=mine drainage metagenome TaxID=410659 RepID=T1CL87_9ZZZZ
MQETLKSSILKAWNSYYRYDPTDIGALDRKFFGNIYIKQLETIVLGEAYSLMGTRGNKFLYTPFGNDKAWILSAGPGKSNELQDLLELQIEQCSKLGIRKIYYSNFSPGYFYPGIDRKRYPEVFNSLTSAGFKEDSVALAMEADIGGFSYEEASESDIAISSLHEKDIQGFLEFVEENFPADCFYRANGVINEGSLQQISVAKVSGKFAGYAMFAAGEGPLEFTPGERFGCFEVSENFRSLGIGTKLLVRTLNAMKAMGIRHTYFLWTTERASHLYTRYGFKVTRKFSIMVMDL